MLTAEDYAAVKIAVEVCCFPNLKRQILSINEKENYIITIYDQKSAIKYKVLWDVDLRLHVTVASLILENFGLVNFLSEKITGYAHHIGINMLLWAKYHETLLETSRDFSISFLKSSHFTSRGLIDNKKAAEEMMKCQRLNVKQKYKLACLYCFDEQIPVLFKQMSDEEQEEFYNLQLKVIELSDIVKFWTFYINGEVEALIGEKDVYDYLMEKAIECGSKAAVEYCIEKTKLTKTNNYRMDAALKCLRYSTKLKPLTSFRSSSGVCISHSRDSCDVWYWAPYIFLIDILCFLLHKLTLDQRTTILRKDIEGTIYDAGGFFLKSKDCSRILSYFLDWPFQDYFMTLADLTWKFLPESNFIALFNAICHKLNVKSMNFVYGDQETYDYNKLLMEFWWKSPQRFKRYIFSLNTTLHDECYDFLPCDSQNSLLPRERKFLAEMLMVKKFTNEVRRSFELILESATDEEKSDIIFSEGAIKLCHHFISSGKLAILDLFVSSCLPTIEQRDKFKRDLCFSENAIPAFEYLFWQRRWGAAESFIRWCSISEEETNQLKRDIFSQCVCHYLIMTKKDDLENVYFEWFSSSYEDIREFKREFIYSDVGFNACLVLVLLGQLEQSDKLARWCLPSNEIVNYKKTLAYEPASSEYIFQIAYFNSEDNRLLPKHLNYILNCTNEFKGGKWGQAETFLKWCFSGDKDLIKEYKKNILCKEWGAIVVHKYVGCAEWEEVQAFLSWLDVSVEEITNMKKKVLTAMITEFYLSLTYLRTVSFIDEWEIELVLKWCFSDKESIPDYKEIFHFWHTFAIFAMEPVKEYIDNFSVLFKEIIQELTEQSEK